MRNGDIIKHKKFKDVCCLVYSVIYANPTLCPQAGVYVAFINLGFVKSWMIGKSQVLDIKDLNEWEICLTPNEKCLRYAKWGKIC